MTWFDVFMSFILRQLVQCIVKCQLIYFCDSETDLHFNDNFGIAHFLNILFHFFIWHCLIIIWL